MWWHATVNIGEAVFMSSFEAKQAFPRAKMQRAGSNSYSKYVAGPK